VYAIAQMQDVLNLGPEARMNFPSKLGGNWQWRMSEQDMDWQIAERLKEMNQLYLR
jgi:4-alpha-glucanotransferase